MAVSAGEIEATLRLKDMLTPQLEKAMSALEKTGKSIKQLGDDVSSFGSKMTQAFTVPLGGAATAAFKFGKDFESAMVKVNTLSGVSADRVKVMRGEILQLAHDSAIGPEELAHGLLVVTSTGLRGAEAMEILRASSRAAAAGLGDTGDIARVLTAAITAYGKENLSAADASDKMFAAVREGGAEADEFAGSLGRVVGIASQVGVSFDEVLTSIATFTRLGVDADEAVTALRGTLSVILRPTGQARKELADLGTSIQQVRANIKENGLAQALIDLVGLTKGNDEAIATIVPNVRALAGVLGTAGSQGKAYAEILKTIQSSTGDLDSAFQKSQETLDFKWKQLLADLQRLAVQLGEKLAPHFDTLVRAAGDLVDRVASLVEWFAKLPKPVQDAAVALGGFSIAIGPAAFAIGNIVSAFGGLLTILGKLGSIGGGAGGASSLLGMLAGLGPAGVLAAGGLGAAAYNAYTLNQRLEELKKRADENSKKGLGLELGASVADLKTAAAATGGFTSGLTLMGQAIGKITIDKGGGKGGGASGGSIPDLTDAVKDLRKELGINAPKDLKNLQAAWDSLPASLKDTEGAIDAVVDAYGKLRPFLTAGQIPTRNIILPDGTISKAVGELEELWAAYEVGPKTIMASRDATVDALEAISKGLAGMSTAFGMPTGGPLSSSLTVPTDGMLPGGLQGIKLSVGEKISVVMKQFVRDDLSGLILGAFQGGGDVLRTIGAGVGGMLGKAILGDAKSGLGHFLTQNLGKTLGGALGSAIPVVGTLLGGLAGKLLGKLFGPSEETAKVSPLRDALFAAAGGLDKYHKSLVDALGAQGDFLTKQILAAKTEKDYTAAVDAANKALEEHAKKLDQVKEMIAGLGSNLAKIVSGSKEWFDQFAGIADDIAEAKKKLDEANKKGDTRAAADAQKDLTDALERQATAAGNSKDRLEDLGIVALASFNAAIQAGYSMDQALAMNHDGISALRKAFEDLGISTDNVALKAIFMQDALLDKNPELLAAAGALADSLDTLAQLGMLNKDTFEAMERVGIRTWESIKGKVDEMGGSAADALLPMQEFLHEAAERAKELGVPLDETLQSLIDQSKELGIWKDKGKSAQDLLLEGLDKLVKKMDEFIDRITHVPDLDLNINTHYNPGDPPPNVPNVPGFAGGSGGLMNFGAGTLAMLHGHEGVFTADQIAALMGGGGGYGGTQVIQLVMPDGRVLAQVVNSENDSNLRMRRKLRAS